LVLILCVLVSLAALLCALAGAGLAGLEITRTPKLNQLWFLAAFEFVTVVASVFGILCGLNRFASGPALAMVCAAMPMIVGGLLGEPALSARLLGQPADPMVLSGVPIKWLALAQIGCGGLLIVAASLTAFARNAQASYRYLWRAALAAIPLVGAAVFFKAVVPRLASYPKFITISSQLVVLLLVVVFFSALVHCLIRAFEAGRASAQPTQGK